MQCPFEGSQLWALLWPAVGYIAECERDAFVAQLRVSLCGAFSPCLRLLLIRLVMITYWWWWRWWLWLWCGGWWVGGGGGRVAVCGVGDLISILTLQPFPQLSFRELLVDEDAFEAFVALALAAHTGSHRHGLQQLMTDRDPQLQLLLDATLRLSARR